MEQAKTLEAVIHTHKYSTKSKNVLANCTLEISGVSFCTASFGKLISKKQDSFRKHVIFA